MPIIPSQRTPISMDVSGAPSIQSAGATETALARVGGAVADTSLQLLEHVKQAEAVESSSKALFQDRYDSEDQIQQLKNAYPDGYVKNSDGTHVNNTDGTPRTITQEYREWANDRFEKNQLGMPSKVAQELYSQHAGAYFSDNLIKVRNDELIQRTEGFKRGQEADLQTGLNRLVQTPSASGAYELSDGLIERLRAQSGGPGKLFSHQAFFDGSQRIKKESAQSALNGYVNAALMEPKAGATRQAAIAEGMSILNGEDPVSRRRKAQGLYTISDSMDPDQKSQFARKFIEMSQIAGKMDLSDLKRETENAWSNLDRGADAKVGNLFSRWNNAVSQKQVSELEGGEMIGTTIAKAAAQKLGTDPTWLVASPADKQARIEDLKKTITQTFTMQVKAGVFKENPNIGGVALAHALEKVNGIAKKADDEIHSDFAKGMHFDPEVLTASAQLDLSNPRSLWSNGAWLAKRSAKLETLGNTYFGGRSPDFRLITKDESQHLSDYLKNEVVSGGDKFDALKALYSADSRHYGSIIDQMIRDKNLGEEWRSAMMNPSRILGAEGVQTIVSGGKIRENGISAAKANGYAESFFDDAIEKNLGPYIAAKAFAGDDSSVAQEQIDSLKKVVKTHALGLYAKDHGALGSPEEYVKRVSGSWIGGQYKALDVGGTFDFGTRTKLLVPRESGDRVWKDSEMENVAKNRTIFLTDANEMKRLGVVKPRGSEDVPDENFNQQVQRTAVFYPVRDNSGFEVRYFSSKDNAYVRLMTAKKDRRGLPVPLFIPMSDMTKEPKRPVERTTTIKMRFMDQLDRGIGYRP